MLESLFMAEQPMSIYIDVAPGIPDEQRDDVNDVISENDVGQVAHFVFQRSSRHDAVVRLRYAENLRGNPADVAKSLPLGELLIRFDLSAGIKDVYDATFVSSGQRIRSYQGRLRDNRMGAFFQEFIDDVERNLGTPAYQRWRNSTEVLITRLDALLQDKEMLERHLTLALKDLDIAHSRIKQLELAKDLLWQERYGVKGQSKRQNVLAIAALVAALTAPLIEVFAGHALEKPVKDTVQQSIYVQVDCGGQPALTLDPPLPASD